MGFLPTGFREGFFKGFFTSFMKLTGLMSIGLAVFSDF
jgi:hypothetical protein